MKKISLIFACLFTIALLAMACDLFEQLFYPTLETPSFSVAAGDYYGPQFVSLNCETEGATIHYTIDGSEPTEDSPEFSGYVAVTEPTTIRAIAVKDKALDSEIASAEYSIHAYSAGNVSSATPCYWMDGLRTDLEMPDGATEGSVRGSNTSSEGVSYICGIVRINEQNMPCYWVDSSYHALDIPIGATEGYTHYWVKLFEGDWYIGGYSVNEQAVQTPCYWKNGEYQSLSLAQGMLGGGASEGIFVSDSGAVYVPGYVYNDTGRLPCYWADGTCLLLNLPTTMVGGSCTKVKIIEEVLYINGASKEETNGPDIPCYWANGSFISLRTPTIAANTGYNSNEVYKFGQDIYIAGYNWDSSSGSWLMFPSYWRNGTLQTLTFPESDCSGGVWSFSQAGGTVVPMGAWVSSSQYTSCYWVDGQYHGGRVYSRQ